MSKCDVNAQSLKQIQTKVAQTLMKARKEPISTLKQNMVTLLNEIAENYNLAGITEITSTIYNLAQKFGVVDQSSNFFSIENLTNLLTGASQGIQRIDTLETSADKLTDTEQVRTRLEANREFLDNAYGLAKEVRSYVERQTNQNLFDCCFINRGSVNQNLGIVRNNSELNENIRQYQQVLLERMADYFNHIIRTSPNLQIEADVVEALKNPVLYDSDNKNTGVLETLRGLINAYLSSENFSPDVLRELYNTADDSTKSQTEREDARRRLDAYNANVILTHFDSYLSLTLGKAIEIKDFNVKTGKNKYQIASKTSKLTTTWRTSEDINVESEADAITKLAINTTPMFRWQGDTPMRGRYLHFSDFEHTIAKVKDLSYREDVMNVIFDDNFISEYDILWDSLSPETRDFLRGKTLSQAINYIRRNPRQYISSIFEILTNQEFYDIFSDSFLSKKVFTDDELNKMYSISKGLFNPTSASSLYTLSGQEFDTDYYSFVTQTVDSIFKVSYIQYFKDQDGIIQVRTLIDQSINNIRRGVEQTINTSNSISCIKNYEDYCNELGLTKNPEDDFKYITFTLPVEGLNIRVKAVASSGTVSFIDTNTNKSIVNFQQLWENEGVRQYLDTVLRLGISTDVDFQNALKNEMNSYNDLCKNLLSFAARVHLNQYVSHEFIQGLSNMEKEAKLGDIYGKGAPRYNFQLDELGLVHGNDIPTLNKIAIAKANVTGVTTASQVKDGDGNGQSLQTLSRLLGSLQSQFDLQERQPWSVTNESILLTVPGLYEGVFTSKEFHNQVGNNKASTNMSVSEMSYAGIVQDFVGGLMQREDGSVVGNGHVLFLPSVNSDKGTIGRLKINLNKEVTINGVQKAVKDLSSAELETLIASEFGKIYTKMYNAITADWAILDAFIASKGIQAPSLAHDYLHGFAGFNIWWSTNRQALAQYDKSPADFIKKLTLEYNRTNRLHPLEIIDQVHYKNNKGNLGINQAFISQIARFNPQFLTSVDPNFNVGVYPTSQQFWATKKAEMLKGLLKSKFRVNTTAATQPELLFIKSTYPDWINYSGDMILGKAVINGQIINITSNRDLATLQERLQIDNVNDLINELSNKYSLRLNPILEKYNYLDYLFTQEFMCATVGSFIAHPEKSNSSDVLQQEAAHFQAQHKRNVSFTAAMHAFQLNLLNGIPEVYNIAVIDDITDEQGTILGLNNGIKPFDGATFVNPFVVILENNSLGGARAGITKKQFVHFKNERTGTSGIIKTAGFGLTNDWIRNSPFLERMMRKMTNHVWLNQDGTPAIVDITTDYKGNKIVFKDSYFKSGDRIFKIAAINSLGNNSYQRIIQEVSADGTAMSDFITESPVIINTNYQLWNFFGGKNSMAMDGRFLKLSNTSIENVVQAMNNTGTVIGSPSRVETQDQLWQPLKHVDVHYVPTAGAVKQGAANINSTAKYSNDEEYDTQRIKMYQSGIQLDKEHHADDSKLSLMTQVISACAAKGYTLEAAIGLYDALRKSTEIGTRDHLDAVRELFTTGSNTSTNLQEVLMKSIVNALGTSQSNGGNFAEIIASNLIRQAREGKAINFSEALLPLSDNTVYSKIFSIISSYLTNAGIKQKIPGILSVLTPSHNIFKLYAGRKYESFTNPEQELAELQAQQIPVYDGTDPNTISNLELGREYFITRIAPEIDAAGNQIGVKGDTQSELIRTPSEYHKLKQDILDGKIAQVVENVTVGRDLAAYNVRFSTTDGSRFQLWDLDSAAALFEYNDTIDTYKKEMDKAVTIEAKEAAVVKKSMALTALFQRVFPGQPIDIDHMEMFLRRTLQRDLMNLSSSTPALNRQYKQLLDSRPVISGTVQSTKIEDRVTDSEVEKNLRKLSKALQTAILSYPLSGSYEQTQQLTEEQWENAVRRWYRATENLTEDEQNILVKILGNRVDEPNTDEPIHISYFLHTGRFFTEDWKQLSQKKIEALTQELRKQKEQGNLRVTPDEYRQQCQAIRDEVETELTKLSLTDHANAHIPGIVDNLSSSVQVVDDQAWFNKYAQWVNIHLGTGLGSKLEINGQKTVVRADNFNDIEKDVRQLLANTIKVRINGQLVDVDKSSVVSQAYELIMPKTFATNFGLKEFDDLNTIQNDPDFFIKQYLQNQATKVEENQYAVELKVSDGNHYYLLTKKQAVNAGLTKVNNIFTIVIDGRTYRVDSNGNTMYELTKDTEIYTDNLGHEVIVTDDLNTYIENLHFDSIKLSNSLRTRPSVVDSLLKGFKKSKKKQVKQFNDYVTVYGDGADSVLQLNQEYHSVSLDTYQSLITVDPATGKRISTNSIIREGWAKHISFLKSLDIVAARIPAQSMQSFMPMKVVAYDNPDINTAHVSTMQILLQGSDFDVDAVSLATFDIDRNGLLQLWSPYANVESMELLDASTRLPIPSGQAVQFQTIDSFSDAENFLMKYRSLFAINRVGVFNKESKSYDISDSEVSIDMTLDTPEKLDLFAQFIAEVPNLKMPSVQFHEKFASALDANGLTTGMTANLIPSIFNKIKEIADDHNMYFDNLSKYNLSKVVNNYTMFSMYRTINDPVNLIQAQTSVDGTTGPLKKESNKSSEAKEASTRTPGNAINKFEGIVENQVGKKGIAICATGLKSFFGLTQYCNFLLNYGTAQDQERILLGNEHKGVVIGGKTYKTLANIRSKDPNSILDNKVMKALASVTNDNDAALTLSALLSLATDNAKELALSKLNAGTKTLGLYVYGISIGMDFKDLAGIMMSDVGRVINEVLSDDVFSEKDGYGNVGDSLFNYFDEGPKRALRKFDIHADSKGGEVHSPFEALKSLFENRTSFKDEKGNTLSFEKALVVFSRSNLHLAEKMKFFEDLRHQYSFPSEEAKQRFSQLIDFVQDYVQQNHIIDMNEGIYEDIKTLSKGAAEMKILGQLFGLNKGLKTSPDELSKQINNIERAIYNHTEKQEDLINLTRFAFEEDYRNQCIAKYEEVKHSFNILDAVSRVPHFMGYVQTLAVAAKEAQNAFKFRSSRNLSLQISKELGYKKEDKIIRGVQNFIGDYLRKGWMRSTEKMFVIPKGNKAFTKSGEMFELTEDTPIRLGTDWGDATFRMWMENEIIPNLKKGIIKPGTVFEGISGNKFIKDLGNDLLTTTVSHNSSVIYTLPINMLPRIDQERAIFNGYKSEFNKLASYSYQYDSSQYTTGEDGQVTLTQETNSIPLVDLFTYYAMIADSWKLGEKSLVPILEDFQNSGIIQDFHNYETAIDKSGFTLDLSNINFDDLLPYVAPFESPYSSFSKFIQYRNPSTRKYELMRRLSNEEKNETPSDNNGGDFVDARRIKDYEFKGDGVDTNYFPAGRVETPTIERRFEFDNNGQRQGYTVTYDKETGRLETLDIAGSALTLKDFPGLEYIPTRKQNGEKKVDVATLESIIRNALNPC